MAMNPDIKAKWVAALRSGEYEQGTGLLHNLTQDNYCCLGVLCKIAADEGEVLVSKRLRHGDMVTHFGHACELLPHQVKFWAGLEKTDPEVTAKVTYLDGRTSTSVYGLSELNDTCGFTFDQIADLIEEQL